ncbi:hypothetical protein [Bacteroides coprosuis]|uniref:hypothetical protein n=1 Tax=Bacteroides coprosuis TaxID=151276 RepID=UPI001D1E83C6|nr:hypothetical protein [Bacteroides coprosuis]HJD92547.1 hypothetical protein [Bacteroides coprosuis]
MKKIHYLFALIPLLLLACSNDDNKATTYPIALWDIWNFNSVEYKIQTNNPTVDSYLADEIQTYFSKEGFFKRLELTNRYQFIAQIDDTQTYNRKYKLLGDEITVYLPEEEESEIWSKEPWTFTFFTQSSQLFMKLNQWELSSLETCIRNHAVDLSEEEILKLIETTRIEDIQVNVVYNRIEKTK